MKSLNLGILAHVDAGKTSLTERLLYMAGIIDQLGSVDAGNTQTDSLDLERRRGITIKSAVASFDINNTKINLIDTPGHPDFIAEVERVLGVLDGAVLVISAVEGVQAQTRVLLRALQRLRIPTLIFVNKIDRRGARESELIRDIAQKLTPSVIALGTTSAIGTQAANFKPYHINDSGFSKKLTEVLANNNEELIAQYLGIGSAISSRQLQHELYDQTKKLLTYPAIFGSAITGAGVDSLRIAITDLLPSKPGNPKGPVSGLVFKIERGQSNEKIAFARIFSGIINNRDSLRFGQNKEAKITSIGVFERGGIVKRQSATSGQIVKLGGLNDIQIGDHIGNNKIAAATKQQFAPPSLETIVTPLHSANKGALHLALTQLAEQDPLIKLRQDDARQELSVSLYGEVQKEVIGDTLAADFGIEVKFSKTTTICVEIPVGTGQAMESGQRQDPFLATVGLRVEPLAPGSGLRFEFAKEVVGTMPLAFFKAVEDTVKETMAQGLYGWQVIDCLVTMTHSGYFPRQSHAHARFDKSMSSTGADFRGLTPLVLMDALKKAGTGVCQPMHKFRLDIPLHALSPLLPVLSKLDASIQITIEHQNSYQLEGDIPAAQVHTLQQQLPALTSGEGVLESQFDHYVQVRGVPPLRPRTDCNPLNRKEYLLHVIRRVR